MVESSQARNRLLEILGPDRYSEQYLERMVTSHDLAPLPKLGAVAFKMMPEAVLHPKETEEVADIVRAAESWNLPITPRGGASWGFGGAVPNKGGLVLDMASMNRIIGLDVDRGIIRVQPGVVWKNLDDWLQRRGYFLPYYPSSAPGATIGGWISTGGVGVGNYKYGSARNNVRNLTVVLPSGNMIDTAHRAASKQPSQFDLTSLFIGAEGSLGIVTSIDLQVYPKPEELTLRSYSFQNMDAVYDAMIRIGETKEKPYHIGFLDDNYFRFLRAMGRHAPEVGGMLNIAFDGLKFRVDEEVKIFDDLIASAGGQRESDETARHEWDERSYELRSKKLGTGAVIGEALIPVGQAAAVAREANELVRRMKMSIAVNGFLIDRDTVAFLPFYLTDERRWLKSISSLSFVKKFLDISDRHGGRPVGLGLFMANNVLRMRDRNTVELLKNIKDTLDPTGRVNGGKTVRLETRFGIGVGPRLFGFGMEALAFLKKLYPRDRYDRPVPGGFSGGEH
ncbi:MAG TPA: FAD-binding oxidoreductase [Euryarchaeota archaeon]|nr:FAD-binding oxidoreductase [Euryarchaeota archaeon]